MVPKLESILICDIVISEPDTPSLIRVREGLHCEQLPGRTRPFTVVLRFRDVRGTIEPVIRLTRVSPETGEDLELADVTTKPAANPHGLGATTFTVRFDRGLELPEEGEYRLRVMIGAAEVGTTRFVALLDPP